MPSAKDYHGQKIRPTIIVLVELSIATAYSWGVFRHTSNMRKLRICFTVM